MSLEKEKDSNTESVTFNFDVGDGLNSDQQVKLDSLLKSHINVFSKDEYDVGTVSAGIEHHIRTVDDQPVKVPYRRVPLKQVGRSEGLPSEGS